MTADTQAKAPTTLNGHEVLASFHTPADRGTREGFVVLVDRKNDFQRYVTAWVGAGDNSWCWGHYIDHRADADADFASRCKRGY